MLRHFQIKSNAPSYSGGKATFEFVNKVQGDRRAAIIGLVAKAAEPSHGSQNTINRLQVAGRSYVQGDPIPLGLLGGTAGGRVVHNGGGTISAIIAALTNIQALTDSTGGTAATTLPQIVRAHGIHTWAGGAAATDSISVTGLAAGDTVLATVVANNAGEYLVKAVNDDGNDQIDLTLSANGADGTTKICYLVLVAGNTLEDVIASLANELATQRTLNTAVINAIASLAYQINLLAGRGPGKPNYFPGRLIPLHDGGFAGGLRLIGGEKIEIELEDLSSTAAPVAGLVLHCVEFPRADQGMMGRHQQHIDQLWQLLESGQGELCFYGNELAQASSAVMRSELEADPNMPGGWDFRRLEVRGACYDDTSLYVDESHFANLTVQLYTSTEKPAQSDYLHGRAVIGDGTLNWPGAVAVDIPCGGSSLLGVAASAPSANKTWRFATIFEGREREADFLHASGAAR